MNIILNQDETQLLIDLLQNRTEQLRVEVRRTDDAQYHDELRALEARTRTLQRKLEGEGEQTYRSNPSL